MRHYPKWRGASPAVGHDAVWELDPGVVSLQGTDQLFLQRAGVISIHSRESHGREEGLTAVLSLRRRLCSSCEPHTRRLGSVGERNHLPAGGLHSP